MMDTLKQRWHLLPISRQMLLLVNAILVGLVALVLAIDYRMRIERQLHEKKIALTKEAKTTYESLLVAEVDGGDAIQGLKHFGADWCSWSSAEDSGHSPARSQHPECCTRS